MADTGRGMKAALMTGAAAAMLTLLGGCYYMGDDDERADDANAAPGSIVSTSGDTQTRRYALDGFSAVTLAGPDDVTIRKGDRFAITATGPAETLDKLVVRIRDGALEIKRRHSANPLTRDGGEVRIAVTLPALHSATLAGSGTMDSDTLSGDKAEATVAGSGTLNLKGIDAGELKMVIAGSGDVAAAGRARSADVSVAGSGSIEAPQMTSESADISIAGSGDVAMAVHGAATVSIIGSGDVVLTGGARCTTSRMGSGNVTCS